MHIKIIFHFKGKLNIISSLMSQGRIKGFQMDLSESKRRGLLTKSMTQINSTAKNSYNSNAMQ